MPRTSGKNGNFEYIVSYEREAAIDATSLLLRHVLRTNCATPRQSSPSSARCRGYVDARE